MLILGIIFVVIAVIGAFVYMTTSEDSFSPYVFILLMFTFWGVFLLAEYVVKKETAIECHKGNNPYRMEIRYELQDSVYVPIDTIYIKK